MKTFLICPGSERAGTTWLYKYLNAFDIIDFGDTKEYHYFDSIYLDEFKHYIQMNKKHDVLNLFYNDDFAYYNYFINILNKKDITGDFSPGYSGLPKKIMKQISEQFKAYNIETKIIYLVRDPIQRHISATNLRIKYDYLNLNNDEYNEILLSNLDDPLFNINSKYKESHEKMSNVFGNNYLIKRYENLFNENSIKEICNFLKIEYSIPDFNVKINERSVIDLDIYESTVDQLYYYYSEEINFINTVN